MSRNYGARASKTSRVPREDENECRCGEGTCGLRSGCQRKRGCLLRVGLPNLRRPWSSCPSVWVGQPGVGEWGRHLLEKEPQGRQTCSPWPLARLPGQCPPGPVQLRLPHLLWSPGQKGISREQGSHLRWGLQAGCGHGVVCDSETFRHMVCTLNPAGGEGLHIKTMRKSLDQVPLPRLSLHRPTPATLPTPGPRSHPPDSPRTRSAVPLPRLPTLGPRFHSSDSAWRTISRLGGR